MKAFDIENDPSEQLLRLLSLQKVLERKRALERDLRRVEKQIPYLTDLSLNKTVPSTKLINSQIQEWKDRALSETGEIPHITEQDVELSLSAIAMLSEIERLPSGRNESRFTQEVCALNEKNPEWRPRQIAEKLYENPEHRKRFEQSEDQSFNKAEIISALTHRVRMALSRRNNRQSAMAARLKK